LNPNALFFNQKCDMKRTSKWVKFAMKFKEGLTEQEFEKKKNDLKAKLSKITGVVMDHIWLKLKGSKEWHKPKKICKTEDWENSVKGLDSKAKEACKALLTIAEKTPEQRCKCYQAMKKENAEHLRCYAGYSQSRKIHHYWKECQKSADKKATPKPTTKATPKPTTKATPKPTTPKKTSRRLLSALAVNGQIEDSVEDAEWLPPLEFPELPSDQEMIDLGVVGSGKSEVDAILWDTKGVKLEEAVDKLKKASKSSDGIKSDGISVDSLKPEPVSPVSKEYSSFAPTEKWKSAAPALMQASWCVVVGLIISLALA